MGLYTVKWVLGLIGAFASLCIAFVVLVFAVSYWGNQANDTPLASGPAPSAPPGKIDTGTDTSSASPSADSTNEDKLRYDPAKVHRSEREANAEFQTRECLSQYSKTLLMEGVRDKKFITNQAVSVCGRVLTIVMTEDGQKPEEVAAHIRSLEDEELDAVVSEGQ